jgi:prolyl 4-hydroxylase
VYLVHDFLTPDECKSLIALGDPILERSNVAAPEVKFKPAPLYWGEEEEDDSTTVSSVRTSSSAFLKIGSANWLSERVAETILLPTNHFESPQICHYLPGQEYLPHHDAFSGGSEHLNSGGNRVATVICYLNDCKDGGSTTFPLVGLDVKPNKGSACIFFPACMNGGLDGRLLHGGAEVTQGEKWLAQVWIRQSAWVRG